MQRGALVADCYRDVQNAAEHSMRVVIVGGGIVGVELAAELIERFPNLNLTLVHSGSALMAGRNNSFPERGSRLVGHGCLSSSSTRHTSYSLIFILLCAFRYAEAHLKARGVNVVLGHRVQNVDDKSVVSLGADSGRFRHHVLITNKGTIDHMCCKHVKKHHYILLLSKMF